MNLRILPAFVWSIMLGFITTGTQAQHTGSYDTTTIFMSQSRALSLYVPASYTPANHYRLVVGLHGLGDTCSDYRTALVGSLSFATAVPNTILICPEAVNRNSDFYTPAGNEAIIQQCINIARAKYNIDTNNIILQGFSLGGRAALRYGMDHYVTFKGLLLNTPAIQGVKEATNTSPYYTFTYANASKIPVYITHGSADITYTAPIDSAYEQMLMHDGIVRFFDYPGMGHTVPNFTQQHFLSFFDSAASPGADADLYAVRVPARSCNTQTAGTCILRSAGTDTLHSIQLQYTLNGTNHIYTWNGTLTPFQHAVVSLPADTNSAASQTLHVKVLSVNNNMPDTFTANNDAETTFAYAAQGLNLPVSEGFEGNTFPPANWLLNRSGDFYTAWDVDNTVSKTGNNSAGTFNTIFYFDNSGRREELVSPVLNLSSLPNPFVQFDVAYNYHEYTPPYFTANVAFADTLEVLVSTDCGAHYTSVYKKGGANLATFSTPIINPLSVNDDFISPADSNWRTDRISLGSFATSSNAVVKFSYISALGGSINIDNVVFSNSASTGVEATYASTSATVFPNPATDMVNIQAGNEQLQQVSVTDLTGKEVIHSENNSNTNEMRVNVAGLSNGIYLFRLTTGNKTETRKVIVQH